MPFYNGLDRLVLQTMMPIAEEVGMGYRFGKKHFVSEGMWEELKKAPRIPRATTRNGFWRIKFRQQYAAILALCKPNAPEQLLHRVLREEFVRIYSESVLQNFIDQQRKAHPGIELPDPHKTGDLDIRQVLASPYFFA